jgi:hypothetical protein
MHILQFLYANLKFLYAHFTVPVRTFYSSCMHILKFLDAHSRIRSYKRTLIVFNNLPTQYTSTCSGQRIAQPTHHLYSGPELTA